MFVFNIFLLFQINYFRSLDAFRMVYLASFSALSGEISEPQIGTIIIKSSLN